MHSRSSTNRTDTTLDAGPNSSRRSRLDNIKNHIHHPMHHLNQRRDAIRGFSPAWFTACMGTGITSTSIHSFPYYWDPLRYISMVLAGLTLLMVVVFTVLFIWRLVKHRDFFDILYHPQIGLTLGAIPMAYSTLTTCIATILGWYHLTWVPTLVVVLWAISVAMSIASLLAVPFALMSHQGHPFDKVTAALFMPVVPGVVAAAAGGTVASVQNVGSVAVNIIIASYVLLGAGLGIVLMFLTFYFIRLVLFKLPPRETIASVFLPLGPLGQATNATLLLGTQVRRVFPAMLPRIPMIGEVVFSVSFIFALLIWALAVWWLLHAVYSSLYTRYKGRVPFNLGWWAFIFPIGTFTAGTNQLWIISNLSFFRVLNAILVATLALLWAIVVTTTICYAWTGELLKPVAIGHLELQDDLEIAQDNATATPDSELSV